MSKDFNRMWENMNQNQRSTYGREYIDHHIKCMASAKDTASYDLHLVTDAMEDALFNVKPKTRYLIPGGSGTYDIYRVGTVSSARLFMVIFLNVPFYSTKDELVVAYK